MKSILVIKSSPRSTASFSDQLTQAIVERLKKNHPQASVKTHHLNQDPPPHLQESHLSVFFAPADKRTPEDLATIQQSEKAVNELMSADAIVIGVPMYNFSIPSVLKAWIDNIMRAGLTFKYGPSGPEGLVKGKKVYLAIASGGVYSEGPMKSYDFTEPYLRSVLGFLGMTDISTFRVEGTSMPDLKETALRKAIESIRF